MNIVRIVAVALLCGATTAAHGAGQGQGRGAGSIDAAIARVADDYVKAALAGDAKGVAALYTEDAIEMPPNQPMIKGRAAIQAYYEKVFGGMKLARFTLTHIESRAMGDSGYDIGTYQQNLTPQGGAALDETGKYVVILKRVGGAWKVSNAIYNGDRPE